MEGCTYEYGGAWRFGNFRVWPLDPRFPYVGPGADRPVVAVCMDLRTCKRLAVVRDSQGAPVPAELPAVLAAQWEWVRDTVERGGVPGFLPHFGRPAAGGVL